MHYGAEADHPARSQMKCMRKYIRPNYFERKVKFSALENVGLGSGGCGCFTS